MSSFTKIKRTIETKEGEVIFSDQDWIEVEEEKFWDDGDADSYAKTLWSEFEHKEVSTWKGKKYAFSFITNDRSSGVVMVEGKNIPTWQVVGEGLKNLPKEERRVVVKIHDGVGGYSINIFWYELIGGEPHWNCSPVESQGEWMYIEDLLNLPTEGGDK